MFGRMLSPVISSLLGHLGYELKRIRKPSCPPACTELSPGAGFLAIRKQGTATERTLLVNLDGERIPKITLDPFHLVKCFTQLRRIELQDVVEYLDEVQAQRVLIACQEALGAGGSLQLVVPDVEGLLGTYADRTERKRDWFAVLFGYSPTLGARTGQRPAAYASWYTRRYLKEYLEVAGFSEIEIDNEPGLLRATCVKKVNRQERQVTPYLSTVRPDHLGRYRFALGYLQAEHRVLDIACGIGYGSYLMASKVEGVRVLSIDIDPEAIEYAKQNYNHPGIEFRADNAVSVELPPESIDVAVSFETIEHVPNDAAVVKKIVSALRPGGVLICSVPNENAMPFSKARYPYHVRHYRPDEFEALLTGAGLRLEKAWSQADNNSDQVQEGWDGQFLIAVSRKPGRDEA